jgi:hypothetical protein
MITGQPTSIRIPAELKAQLQHEADNRGMTMAALIQWLIRSFLHQCRQTRVKDRA